MPSLFDAIQPLPKKSITRSQTRLLKKIKRVVNINTNSNFEHMCKTSMNDRITMLQKNHNANNSINPKDYIPFLNNRNVSRHFSNISVTVDKNGRIPSLNIENKNINNDSTVLEIHDDAECTNVIDLAEDVASSNESVILIEDSNANSSYISHFTSNRKVRASTNVTKASLSGLNRSLSIISIPDDDEDQNIACEDDKDIIFVKEETLKPNKFQTNLQQKARFKIKKKNKPKMTKQNLHRKKKFKNAALLSLCGSVISDMLKKPCVKCNNNALVNCVCRKKKSIGHNLNSLNSNFNQQSVLKPNSGNVSPKKSPRIGAINRLSCNFINSNVITRTGLREIIIDGSNVALGHTNGRAFSVKGLKIAIDYFLHRGHKVTAFVPQYRQKHNQTTDPALLNFLVDKGYVVFTPSREVNGRRITPYDDRYIIQYATSCEGIVVSSDNYRDLFLEKPEWRSTIERRLLMPTWVGDMLMFPEDPLGRHGPKLSRFLKFP